MGAAKLVKHLPLCAGVGRDAFRQYGALMCNSDVMHGPGAHVMYIHHSRSILSYCLGAKFLAAHANIRPHMTMGWRPPAEWSRTA
jgi:hypothetical protein